MKRNKTNPLHPFFREDTTFEIGVDEAGRGPLFGRLYVAATILPKTDFRHEWMKDSKRFSSQKKIREVAEYIKSNAIAWTVRYAEPELIDELNIRQAVLRTMRECCRDLIEKIQQPNHISMNNPVSFRLLVDGNDFPPFTTYNPESETLEEVESYTVEGGDNLYTCITAASILAKEAHDRMVKDICAADTSLDTKYALLSSKGYGTLKHRNAIKEHGMHVEHRKLFLRKLLGLDHIVHVEYGFV
jgi:ribonuclease HII